ncbi:hypothetical protein ACRAWG_27020 [Methylobacterium sp. P31]
MTDVTRGWGRRTGTAAVLALALGAACPAGAVPLPKSQTASAAADGPDVPAHVTVGPGGRDLRLTGDLTAGVAARVAEILAAHPQIERIDLTSDGGLVEEGTAIGALVAARGLATYVPDACASACMLVFVRGRARYLGAGGRLGFHAPYAIGAHGRVRAVDPAPERAAYRAAGLSRAFVARALAVPPAGIWIPEPAELRAAGIVTEIVGPDRFPDPARAPETGESGPPTSLCRSARLPRHPPSRGRRSRTAPGRRRCAPSTSRAGAYLRTRSGPRGNGCRIIACAAPPAERTGRSARRSSTRCSRPPTPRRQCGWPTTARSRSTTMR